MKTHQIPCRVMGLKLLMRIALFIFCTPIIVTQDIFMLLENAIFRLLSMPCGSDKNTP